MRKPKSFRRALVWLEVFASSLAKRLGYELAAAIVDLIVRWFRDDE